MDQKTCCVTGNRDIPTGKAEAIERVVQEKVLYAIREGYTHFISGFAQGADLIFAQVVADLKAQYPITLEAAIPYAGRMKTPDKLFQSLIRCCDLVNIHAKLYIPDCYRRRNRYMVEQSALVIGIHDGRTTGGTASTLDYARKLGKEVWQIYWL